MHHNELKIEKTPLIEKFLALLLLIILFPLLFLLLIISYLDTKKFPIFIQERGLSLTKYRFKLIKLRTIRESQNLENEQINSSILKKSQYYNNVSEVGKFLRKTGLDELPQLLNILLGDMRFIGPRALSIDDLEKIKANYPEYYKRRNELISKPGILGLWQVNKDFECSIEKLIELDEEYEKNKSLLMNVKILIKALEIILLGYHIDSIVNGKGLKVYPVFIYASIISFGILLFIILIFLGGW